VIDEYLALFEAAWDDPPDRCMLQWNYQSRPMDRKFYDEVAKVGSLHMWFDRGGGTALSAAGAALLEPDL
jgi:hypothetical protein